MICRSVITQEFVINGHLRYWLSIVRFILLFTNVSFRCEQFSGITCHSSQGSCAEHIVFFSIVCAMVMVVIVVRILVVFVELCGLWSVWHAGGYVVIVAVSMVQVLWC